jgi:hypothetical protein
MRFIGSSAVSAVVALAVAVSPVRAMASTPPAGPHQARSPWVTLSMLTPAGASALSASATTVAAQPETPPPPPPAVEGRGFHPPLAVIAVWLADIALMIYIATRDDDDEEAGESPT